MQYVENYVGVTVTGGILQAFIDAVPEDLVLLSGGDDPGVTEAAASLVLATGVPLSWTLEWTMKILARPANFTHLSDEHLFVGVIDQAGSAAGLYFADSGIAYTAGLGGPLQALPGSHLIVNDDDYYTYRMAVDWDQNLVYVFITRTADLALLGHQLRFTLPVLVSTLLPGPPPSGTTFSSKGVVAGKVKFEVDSVCLGTGVILPNLPPVADAGNDQSLRTCSIGALNGSASYDPEGHPLTYAWRLIDAPLGSAFEQASLDGTTHPLMVPTGFTDKLHSALFSTGIGTVFHAGDVLLVAGVPYNVIAYGNVGADYFAQISAETLPDNLLNVPFKVLAQHGISGPLTVKPTFYPDTAGIFKFDLTVNDGQLSSLPAETVLIVVESSLPRGIVPDLRFLWQYLSDFWDLVEDKAVFETFFSAMAQAAATELFTLWQIDYNKSLRDIQRTFNRRWLHYDPEFAETFPDLTTTRMIRSGVDSALLASPVAANRATLVLQQALYPDITVTFYGADPFTVPQLQAQLQAQLQQIDKRFEVLIISNRNVMLGSFLRITAPFSFTVGSTSTVSFFTHGQVNGPLQGGGGSVLTTFSYQTGKSLVGLGLVPGDLLVIDGAAYRLTRVQDHPADAYPLQRLVLDEEMPITASSTWVVPSQVLSPSINFYSSLCVKDDLIYFEVIDTATGSTTFPSVFSEGVSPLSPATLGVDLSTLDAYISQPALFEVFLYKVRRQSYIVSDPLVVDVPYLQEIIKNPPEDQVLRRNIDFFLDTFRGVPCLRFDTRVWGADPPPPILWAEYSYLDNRPVIEANFGIPAGFTLDDLSQISVHLDYLSAVTGLWYAYFNGPTVHNLRVGTQILLGLPYAEAPGTILELRDDFSVQQGRMLVADLNDPEVVRSYHFPKSLAVEINPVTKQPYVVGDTVALFAPLVNGAEIIDYIKDPTWFVPLLEQGVLTEVEKLFRFLVRVDSAAFNLSALLFVRSFILRIKPRTTFPLFVVREQLGDTEVQAEATQVQLGKLTLFASACSALFNAVATMWDQPNPGPTTSHVWGKYDVGSSVHSLPSFPAVDAVQWGFDKEYELCPEDSILATATIVSAAPIPLTFDSIFIYDAPVYQNCDPSMPITITFDMDGPPPVLPPGTYCTVHVI